MPSDFIIDSLLYACQKARDDITSLRGEVVMRRTQNLQLMKQVESTQEVLKAAHAFAQRVHEWSKAYPLHTFPEPDVDRVRAVLEGGGLTIDCVSASNMRHVVETLDKEAAPLLALLGPL